MLSSFFIAFREGLEAFLIIGIIISYLFKTGGRRYIRQVFLGAVSAIALSVGIAFLFELLLGGFEGKKEQIFEGSVMLLAVIVLTYMIFWMNKQAGKIKSDIEVSVEKAIDKGRIFSLFFLGFIVVFREGAETVLFFRAISYQTASKELIAGAAIGIISSIILALIFFISTIKINISLFFRITGILIMFIAAGLFSESVHEFEEAGILPAIRNNVYDISRFISKDSVAGGILKSLFGYNPSPSLLEIIIYTVYLALIAVLIRRFFYKASKIGK
ncbi:MAG: FTR1 family protein [Actinobacteria bacterium]|nr:FTR1 family protein [Actinomycetota bacterium]MCL6088369.1 FTR1 family protein [Actinomycetota bacterium]